MKILVNRCYGGIGFSDFGMVKLKENNLTDDVEIHTNPKVIELFEKYGNTLFDDYSNIELEELPNDITDYDIEEYDGYETIIYVLNGKIHYR